MPKFTVTVERWYRARHVFDYEIEAENEEAALEAAQEALDHDPCDSYEDTNLTEGYDDAGSWHPVTAAEITP